MKKSKAKSSFSGKIKQNAETRKRTSSYGYLNIPKGVDVFNAEPGSKVTFDIMPYTVTDKHHLDAPTAEVGELWYKKPFRTHRSVGVNNDTVVCPTTFGKKCPICEYRNKLRKEGGDEDEIKALKPSERNLYAIILRGKKANDKVHLFDFSDYLFQERFEEQLQDWDEFESFPDHTCGSSITVRFAENNFGGNKFADPTRFDFVARPTQYDDDILKTIPNLDEVLNLLSYEELRAKFFEIDDESEDDEEEEVEHKSSRKKKSVDEKPKKKHVEEDDDEDEDEEDLDDEDEDDDDDSDDEDEDDNEDADDDSDDDDDDDDEDEDEDDDEPVRKPSKTKKPEPSRSRNKKVPAKAPAKTSAKKRK